ncbi:MAG TPA: cyclic nucleotide-binding domain-containing protein [Rectinemataceae bacterium]|nr:cyclic nucleotide-binding domain-containing protein [Rectinemataceae bacterium]
MPSAILHSLAAIVPFRYLREAELRSLLEDSEQRSYEAGDVLIDQGDLSTSEVYVLISGSVESVDMTRTPPFRMNVVESGSFFGERACLLDNPRTFRIRALEAVTCLVITGERFLRLLASSRSFAQGLGTKLREGYGIFEAFDRFNSEIAQAVADGHVEVRRIVELYKQLEPALHPLASDEARIDWAALTYAVRRLPQNLTRSFVFLLTDNLPTVYASPELLFPFVPTESRHRFVYEMMSGKDMVLVRDGLSDLVDFITCLCVFAVEAKKIRYRLNHPDLILALEGAKGRDGSRAEALLERLPFDEEERAELRRLWPTETATRIREIVFHRQAFSLDIRKQVNNYNGRLSEHWASQVGAAAGALLGVRPSDFPEELEVHIVSSNTHSVSNCLNPFFARHAEEILGWAGAEGLRGETWTEPFDEVYQLARRWLDAFPEHKAELEETERVCRIVRLPETVTTGIQVQLIDAAAVCGKTADPALSFGECRSPAIIVNIDYAFGEQAEEIMRSLLLLFGSNVRSINVLGKAGALVGSRGDVILPTAFIEQSNDAFQPLPGEDASAVSRLKAVLPGRGIHTGPLLTVGGTLLQNRAMLQFYRRIWGCVGLEMEGIWYLRAVFEAEQLGVLRPGAKRRFLYYVSDVPLAAGQRLSERMAPTEGIPPLYAITREVLGSLFRPSPSPAISGPALRALSESPIL